MPLDGYLTRLESRPTQRVALFSGNYNYTLDGANKTLNRLVGHLLGVERMAVRVYSPTTPTPAFPPVGDLVSAPSVVIPGRPDYRFALGLTRSLRRDVEAFAPDLFHLSAPDLLGTQALKLGRMMDVPVVASVHTLFDSYLDYYALGCLKGAVRRRLQRFYSECDYVLAPTRLIAEQLEAGGLGGRARIWSRGVDPALFNPGRRDLNWRRARGFADHEPVIVFFGRLVMEKGLAAFAEAIGRLERTRPQVQVLVVGDGPAAGWFRGALPRTAVFTGFLEGEALATAVASGDVLINPSATEAFGNVNLEAMASGLAMICADVPNMRQVAGDGALYCDPRDPAAFAAAAGALIDDPGRRGGLAVQALAHSFRHRWPEILAGVARTYREAVATYHDPLRVQTGAYGLTT